MQRCKYKIHVLQMELLQIMELKVIFLINLQFTSLFPEKEELA